MKRLLTKGKTMTIDWSEGKVAWSFVFFFLKKGEKSRRAYYRVK
jgi:hypothetical protein